MPNELLDHERSRAKRLKLATSSTHEALDSRILSARPFLDRARYARFLRLQYGFHRSIAFLYVDPDLRAIVPDLEARARLVHVEQDMRDLGLRSPPARNDAPSLVEGATEFPTALGWLYVAEGSSLGAAFLSKAARALDLDDRFGARHLAGHPDGRAHHWRTFTHALDGVGLPPEDEEKVIAGARSAFAYVRHLADVVFDD